MPMFYVAQPLGYSIQTAEIDNDAVTYAKIQNVSATDKVLGRSTAGAGDVEEIACTAAGRALIDDAAASNQRTTLGLGDVALETAPLAVAKGGTALAALGTALQVLRTNAAANALEFATLSSTQDVVKMHSGTGSTTNTSDEEIGTKTFTAGDFAVDDLIVVEVEGDDTNAASVSFFQIRVYDGTNTFTTGELNNTNNRPHHASKISQSITSTSLLQHSGTTISDAATVFVIASTETSMIANWITSAFTISLRGRMQAGGTLAKFRWKVYKVKQ